jgi:hypothetical protein
MRAHIKTVFIAFLLISFQACSSRVETTNVKASYANSQKIPLISRCRMEGFTITDCENILNEIKQPFMVRIIKGKIIDIEDDYGWSKDIPVLFEVRAINNKGKFFHTYADENGIFKMSDIPEGQYCFKATICGWQSVMGVIIVSKTADPKNEIVFKMLLDF